MSKYACIELNTVTNIIVISDQELPSFQQIFDPLVNIDNIPAKIGDTYNPDNGTFTTPAPTTEFVIQKTIEENQAYAQDLMHRMKTLNLGNQINILQGLWIHHRLRALEIDVQPILGTSLPLIIDLLNMVVSGDVECGCVVMQFATPDDMSKPYHILSQSFINWIVSDMKSYLGWP